MGLLRFLEWIESKMDRPAKRHAIFPGSEQMVDSDVAKAQAETVRNRRHSRSQGPGLPEYRHPDFSSKPRWDENGQEIRDD